MKRIGIIGKGFVGSAVANGFSAAVGYKADVKIYDKDTLRSVNTLEEIVEPSEVVFISVPTPSNKDGSNNLDILEECLEKVNKIASNINSFDAIYLIRSTVVPGTTRGFQEKFPKLKLVFNPEFLTERSANFDFISQTRFILGGLKENTLIVDSLYRDRFGETVSILNTDFESAEMVKLELKKLEGHSNL